MFAWLFRPADERTRYQHLDEQKRKLQELKAANPNASFEITLAQRVNAFGGESALPWIYYNDIEDVWEQYLEGQKGPSSNEVPVQQIAAQL